MKTILSRPHEWPRDQADFIFLGRAVEAVGKALFGASWNGAEISTQPLLSLPPYEEAKVNDKLGPLYHREAHEILLAAATAYKAKPVEVRIPGSLSLPSKGYAAIFDYSFSKAYWDVAVAIRQKQIDERMPALRRLSEVRNKITELATIGRLTTGLRSKNGSAMERLNSNMWSILDISNAFSWCQINPKDPTSHASLGEGFMWVFVSRASLDEALESIRSAPSDQSDNIEQPAKDADTIVSENTNPVRRPAAKAKSILQAVHAIWPAGIPDSLPVGERDRKIIDWCKGNNGPQSLSTKHIQRTLKAAELSN